MLDLPLAPQELGHPHGSPTEAGVVEQTVASPDELDRMAVRQLASDLTAETVELIAAFRRDSDLQALVALFQIRRGLAEMLAGFPNDTFAAIWDGSVAQLHEYLMVSELRQMPTQPDDEPLIASLSAAESPTAGQFAARMLMEPSPRWPLPGSLRAVPPQLADRLLDHLLQSIEIHHEPGDADRAARHLAGLIDLVHRDVMSRIGGRDHDWAIALAQRFTTRLNTMQAYFCSDNLREMYAQRGNLIALRLAADGIPVLHGRPPRLEGRPGERIRVGVLANHFAPQTESWFTFSHLDALDRQRFEVTLYASRLTGHPMESLFLSRADHLKVLPAGNVATHVALLRQERLDVLVHATNATVHNSATAQLAACRVAPLQIATVASPVTTGGAQVDVLLNAAWNEPHADARDHYTEHLELMDGSVNYYAYQHDHDVATIDIDRASLGLPQDACVLFSGSNFFKLIPEQTRTWMKLLQRLPDAVLVLMPFNPNWSRTYQRLPFMMRLQRELLDHGLAPDRVKVVDPVPTRADVHRVIALADVYLDAYPFSGACSLIDPLTVGVPPVVRQGRVGRSQHGASLMKLVGLESLVCDDEERYLDTAVRLATDPGERQRVRTVLQHAASQPVPPWLDTPAFSQRVGNALERLVTQQRARYRDLATVQREHLLATLQGWADAAVPRRAELLMLTDSALATSLLMPYFETLGAACGKRMIDVGACYGTMAVPFLAAGWTADLFEPDPRARERARAQLAPFAGQWRMHAMAVSERDADEVTFHKAQMDGLSGLAASPFGPTAQTLSVRCVRLDTFCRSVGPAQVDLVKIDTEGFDFDVLRSIDLDTQQPKLVMLEYGTHFERQSAEAVRAGIQAMADAGWDAVIFDCTDDGQFSQGRWIHRLRRIVLTAATEASELGFGNIVFYRRDDRNFLLAVASMLESCQPAREVWQAR